MIRLMIAILAVAAFLALAPAAPVPTHLKPKQKFHFPTIVETKWVYQTADGERNEEIEQTESVEGGTRIVVCNGNGASRSSYLVSEDGLAVVGSAAVGLGEPFWIFRDDPNSRGNRQWVCRLLVPGAVDAEGTCFASGPEKVTVPAGAFQAVKVKLEMTLHQRNEITRWYASGVGMIREERDGKVVVLKSFRLGPAAVAPLPRPIGR